MERHNGALPRELHVWRAAAHPVLASNLLESTLAPDDRPRAARIRDVDARARFIIARAALRDLIGRYTGALPDRVRFRYSAHGKPTLAEPNDPLGFSISHTADLVLLAIWRNGAVGIDAERVRIVARAERITARLFPEPVGRRLLGMPDEERRVAFFHAWTQREAYVKAIGGTLFRTQDPLPLLWPPAYAPQRIRLSETGGTATWTLCTLRPVAGFIASVVAEGEVGRVRVLEYPSELDRIDGFDLDGPAA